MSGPTPNQPAPASPDPGDPQLKVGGGKGLRIAIAVVGVLLLIAGCVAGGLILFGGEDDEPTKGTEESSSPSVSETGTESTSAPESTLDVPTIDPSDFPTSTDLPSVPDLPPSVTDFPTSFPSDGVPSEFPSDSAGWDAWFSEQIEQVQP